MDLQHDVTTRQPWVDMKDKERLQAMIRTAIDQKLAEEAPQELRKRQRTVLDDSAEEQAALKMLRSMKTLFAGNPTNAAAKGA